jgi:putative ABC transport system substrate-binding protein
MIDRRHLLGTGLALAAAPGVLLARERPARIFMILFRGPTAVERGFKDYFKTHGIEAEFIERDVALDVSKVPALVAEARALKADLIYTWGTPVTLAVVGKEKGVNPERHVTDIPVIFTMVASPEGSGLVSSRQSSGRNLTGTCHVVPLEQQISALRAYRPFERVAVIFNPAEPNSVLNVKELRAAATRIGFTLVERAVPLDGEGKPQPAALPGIVEELARQKVQVLYIGPDSFVAANRQVVTETALAQRLPSFSATEILLREGKALFGLVSGYENVGRLTAFKAAQILEQKTAPRQIPIETLARFSYLVNMSVAAELDQYPPLKVINFAEVIR